MSASPDRGSATPILESTETDGAHVQNENDPSPIRDEQWRAMKLLIDALYNYREEDGHDPSKPFHRKVNRRTVPDYYDVIKEPIAMSTLKSKLNQRDYQSFSEFVRDCALISHNAQTYNLPEAGVYQDALILKRVMETEFQKLADQKIITPEEAALPDLGEIPPADPQPIELAEEDDEDDEEDDEDDEMDESDEEEPGRRKRKRGPRSSAAILKREGAMKDDGGRDVGSKKKRGRPPRVDTPMEARIKAVLKGVRKPKNDLGQIMIHHFERLPDKAAMPEYFAEIKEPIAIELIKRKQKRKKYNSVDHFMRDMDTMFENAKSYNQDESQIYKDAVHLQAEAHRLAEQEKAKPDSDFVMEEGRLPLPNGIVHNNELWKVGDWVHLQNANDVTKPIVAQIYRTWQDSEGQMWVNACWYYRPEQTVHHYEKHFYVNEVVKTGQYRDHHVDEIIDRCFVMFFTRYSRGRPRGLAPDKEVYVCEARYNEEKHKLNKIKTWASCLPDEVRDKDYEMDLFDGHRKEKKVPSPLLHLLKGDAKDVDEPPKPRWGADNAPPIVGAVYKGLRDENQSPPPEPTPSPPPQPPPPPPRQISDLSNNPSAYRKGSDGNMSVDPNQAYGSTPTQPHATHTPSYPQQAAPQYHGHSISPAPSHYGTQASNYTPQHPSTYAPQQPQPGANHYSTPSRYAHQNSSARTGAFPGDVNGPKPSEIYIFGDTVNAQIPEDIRAQFHHDEKGRVLFFTSPPVDVLAPNKKGEAAGHSLKYVAEKLRKADMIKRKKAELQNKRRTGEVVDLDQYSLKKIKMDEDTVKEEDVEKLTEKALLLLINQMNEGADEMYKDMYGDKWEEGKKFEQEKLAALRAEFKRQEAAREEHEKEVLERERIMLKRGGIF